MTTFFDGNGNQIEISNGGSRDIDVTNYKIYNESDGTQSRQAVLTYKGTKLYPINKSAQRENEKKLYDDGLMVTLGDSYTAYLNSFFDTFANEHGLIQKNVGLASSKIARPEGGGQDTIKSFVTRLDELIASFPITVNEKTYNISDVRLITFMGGANDWTTIDADKNVDRIGDRYSTDKGQIYGATKYCLETLQKTFPTADIIVILQPNNANNSDFCVMEQKENIVKECAEMYSIPICDCCFDFYSPANPNDLSTYWNEDKLHLNAAGHQALIDKLEATLNTLSYYKKKIEMFTAFLADFSGSTPSVDQFYSWENRVYGKSVYDSLSNIRCENNIVYLTSVYNTDLQKWVKQMICTAGLFESDNFICEFEAKYDEKAGSWQNVITYGTGTYWTNGLYSDGIKWPAGGEIDAFEQAGAYSDNPVTFCTPTAHYGSGRESGYINTIEHVRGLVLQFEPGKWQKYKFSLQNGHVDIYLNDVLKQSGDFSNCTVNNNYLYNYKPFLKPQAFYLDGSCADESDTNNSYEFAIKNFKIYQNEEVECTGLEIYPQMWDKGTTLVFPVGAELFMDKIFTPSNVSNKACKWESSNKTVATVVEGYVKTLAEGSTVITATCGDVKSTYTLTVSNTQKNIPCVGLSVEDQSKQLEVDEVVSFKTYVYPNFTTEKLIINGTNGIVEYDGTNLTAKKAGTATVTITCGSKQTSFNVSVKEKITDAHVLSYTFDNSTIGDNIVVENKGSLGSEYNLTVKCAKGPADSDTNVISTVSALTIPTRSAGESYAIIMDLYDVLDRSVKKAIQGTGRMYFTEIESALGMPQIGSTFVNCSTSGPWQGVNNGNPSGFLIDNPCRVALWRDSHDKAYIITSKDTEPQIISKDTANTYIKDIIKIKMNAMRINKLDIYYCDKTLDEIKALLND